MATHTSNPHLPAVESKAPLQLLPETNKSLHTISSLQIADTRNAVVSNIVTHMHSIIAQPQGACLPNTTQLLLQL
jgi:hypothetical protein